MDELRKKIDLIDLELMKLIDQRFEVTKEIGKFKKNNNIEVTNSNREEVVLSKADKYLYEQEIKELYLHMFKQNKAYQAFEYGLIGKELPYTLSPLIYQELGLNNYQVIETNNFLKTIKKIDFKGVNITNPYKTDAFNYCALLDDSSKITNTVNTIIGNKGYNTDYLALKKIFEDLNINSSKDKVVIIGNGATSRSVNYALGGDASFLVRHIKNKFENSLNDYKLFKDYDYIINTTPYGTSPNIQSVPLFSLEGFNNLKMVIDVVYNPFNTPIILEAKKHGIKTLNGLKLLVEQANINYGLFTGNFINKSNELISKINKKLFNIVIIGLSYSGKSTIGEKLAKKMNKEFIDTDQILKNENHDLNTLIKNNPVSLFREYEKEVVNRICIKQSCIISTGGGIVLSEEAILKLKANGLVVFINPSLNKLISRLDDSRPLLNNKDDFIKMYHERIELYHKYSDVIITGEEELEKIEEIINENLSN